MDRRRFVTVAGATALAAVGPRLWAAEPSAACTGTLAEWKKMKCLEGLEVAFEFLQKTKLEELPLGQTPIEGEDVFVRLQKINTKPVEGTRVEVHRKYIDVQYLIKGQESMGFVPQPDGLEVLQPFDAAKDNGYFARPANTTMLPVREGQFAVFFPGQGHVPGCHLEGPHEVLKAVVKVSAEWRARHLGK